MEREPNHVCKYSKCQLGENGQQKHYYACPDCDKYYSYRSMGCCFEHYALYQNEVAIARKNEIPFPEFIEKDNNDISNAVEDIVEDVEVTEYKLELDNNSKNKIKRK